MVMSVLKKGKECFEHCSDCQLFKDLSPLYHNIFHVVNFSLVSEMTVGGHSLHLFSLNTSINPFAISV